MYNRGMNKESHEELIAYLNDHNVHNLANDVETCHCASYLGLKIYAVDGLDAMRLAMTEVVD